MDQTVLKQGKVKVWDKASKNFATKTINKGGQYRSVAQEGRLRIAFTVTVVFAPEPRTPLRGPKVCISVKE